MYIYFKSPLKGVYLLNLENYFCQSSTVKNDKMSRVTGEGRGGGEGGGYTLLESICQQLYCVYWLLFLSETRLFFFSLPKVLYKSILSTEVKSKMVLMFYNLMLNNFLLHARTYVRALRYSVLNYRQSQHFWNFSERSNKKEITRCTLIMKHLLTLPIQKHY